MLQKTWQNSVCTTQDPNKIITNFIDYVFINRKKISPMYQLFLVKIELAY